MPKQQLTVLDAVSMAGGLLAALEESGAGRAENPLDQAAGLQQAYRAFHLLILDRLYPIKDQFPVTNQALMAVPNATIDPVRDSLAHPADFLAPIDLIDLISDEGLPCVAPHLHRGWQDRTESCRHARQLSSSVVGFSIDREEREALLAGLAVCNRVSVLPPPLELEPESVHRAYGPVLRLIERLAEGSDDPVFKNLSGRIIGT
jgi:ribosomal protein S12 methylthiotransferase accessory factor YcaO